MAAKPDPPRIEAEQCSRTASPALAELAPLDKRLATWPAEPTLLFADETGAVPFTHATAARVTRWIIRLLC